MLKLNMKNCCGFCYIRENGSKDMLKILHKDYKDKVKRLLSVMLPIIGTQIAIMGMNFF